MVLDTACHVCLNCDATFVGLEAYVYHKQTVYDRHRCRDCDVFFSGLANYTQHKKGYCDAARKCDAVMHHGGQSVETGPAMSLLSLSQSQVTHLKSTEKSVTKHDKMVVPPRQGISPDKTVVPSGEDISGTSQALSHQVLAVTTSELSSSLRPQMIGVQTQTDENVLVVELAEQSNNESWSVPQYNILQKSDSDDPMTETYFSAGDDADDMESDIYADYDKDSETRKVSLIMKEAEERWKKQKNNRIGKHVSRKNTKRISPGNGESVTPKRTRKRISYKVILNDSSGEDENEEKQKMKEDMNDPDFKTFGGGSDDSDWQIEAQNKSQTKRTRMRKQKNPMKIQTNKKAMGRIQKTQSRQKIKHDNRKTRNSEDSGLLDCFICKKGHSNKHNFKYHLDRKYHQKRVGMLKQSMLLAEKCQHLLLRQCRYQCLLCNFYCAGKIDMEHHMKMPLHARKMKFLIEPVVCVNCKSVARSNRKLVEHIKSMEHQDVMEESGLPCIIKETSRNVVCPKCDLIVKNAADLRKHLSHKHHDGDGEKASRCHYRCNHCDHIATTKDRLHLHYKGKHLLRMHDCQSCDETFIDHKQLKAHQYQKHHVSKKGSEYFCKHCGRKFVDDKKKQLHELTHNHILSESTALRKDPFMGIHAKYHSFINSIHNLNTKTIVTCPECGKTFTQRNAYPHLRMHSKTKPFKCMLCLRAFARTSTLRNHLVHHLQIREHKCLECGKYFFGNKDLRGHMQAMHSSKEDKKVICDVCGEKFVSDELLKRHHTLNHLEKTFHCPHPECTYSFRIKAHLDEHQVSHRQDRPFLCDECGFAAKSKKLLRQHRKIHSATKSFSCKHCNYKGISQYHVMRHSRLHTSTKPYKCPYCDYGCNTIGNLKAHTNSRHNGLPVYPCKQCEFGTNNAQEIRSHMITVHDMEQKMVREVMSHLGVYDQKLDLTEVPIGSTAVSPKERKQKIHVQTAQQKLKKTRKRSAAVPIVISPENCDGSEPAVTVLSPSSVPSSTSAPPSSILAPPLTSAPPSLTLTPSSISVPSTSTLHRPHTRSRHPIMISPIPPQAPHPNLPQIPPQLASISPMSHPHNQPVYLSIHHLQPPPLQGPPGHQNCPSPQESSNPVGQPPPLQPRPDMNYLP